jgi:hypothetical protein
VAPGHGGRPGPWRLSDPSVTYSLSLASLSAVSEYIRAPVRRNSRGRYPRCPTYNYIVITVVSESHLDRGDQDCCQPPPSAGRLPENPRWRSCYRPVSAHSRQAHAGRHRPPTGYRHTDLQSSCRGTAGARPSHRSGPLVAEQACQGSSDSSSRSDSNWSRWWASGGSTLAIRLSAR